MILVTGANGVVGRPLCELLETKGKDYRAVTRSAKIDRALHWDLNAEPDDGVREQINGLQCVIHAAPLWLLPTQLPVLKAAGMTRLLAFSSSSVLSKSGSGNQQEQRLVSQLSNAEKSVQFFCEQNEVAYTIFRPSMIYGYGRDQNVTKLASFIRRFSIAFVAGEGSGKRQPVHADDLAIACLFVIENSRTEGKTYTLSGAEAFSYRAMLERIFEALGKRAHVISLPLPIFRLCLRVAALVGRFSYTPDMADRMNQDLSYDFSAATRDFGFMPRKFLQNAEQDLGGFE